MAAAASPPNPDVTGIVLAGGRSTRFGRDKASALLQGRPLLDWVLASMREVAPRLVVVRAAGQVLPLERPGHDDVLVVDDFRPAEGPVVGLLSGLRAVNTPVALVTSCDVPLVQPAVLRLLLDALGGADAAIPVVDGRGQPLVAAYRVRPAVAAVQAALDRGERGLQRALAPLHTAEVTEERIRACDPGLLSFHDLDEPALLEALERRLSAR
jgi:molybdopterin-guanine dinucleotide biosynthesis protein A